MMSKIRATIKYGCIQIADCCMLFAYSFFRIVPNGKLYEQWQIAW